MIALVGYTGFVGSNIYASANGGIDAVYNSKNIENEISIVEKAVEEIETKIVHVIPRSGEIQVAENAGGTVFEFLEESEMKEVYIELANKIIA